ncbi:hypothetical protein [Streptomyces sp. NPDC047976]|uniref:hypothetical protein n=1 Tax=unclassified Streptomyces TaxID=2593676 RepID=UPI00342BE815
MNSADGRRGAAVGGLLLVAALASGCAAAGPTGPDGRAAAEARPGSPAARPVDARELLAAALPDDEIAPAGSAEKKVYEPDPGHALASVGAPDCVTLTDPYRDGPQPATVVQTFHSKENLEWTGATTLTAHPGPTAAAGEFDRLRKAVQGCREFHWRDVYSGNGTGTRATLTAVQAPAQGDEAVAYTLTLLTDVSDINPEVPEIRTIRRVAVVRIGSVIAQFRLEPSPSAETMEFPAELMARQVQRLRSLP